MLFRYCLPPWEIFKSTGQKIHIFVKLQDNLSSDSIHWVKSEAWLQDTGGCNVRKEHQVHSLLQGQLKKRRSLIFQEIFSEDQFLSFPYGVVS